ncbi:MAG: hypothetical protein EZS28_022346 [Streblomastix strix]|uniref:Protein kinase domain-containing protein n=1 Tax=Streblomastix strix TaxID=222440 RepID=A0A5J4VHM6_9EUKA|nr:MAG: hypothetical protein EZS28_022346 [Streblomastix strix]
MMNDTNLLKSLDFQVLRALGRDVRNRVFLVSVTTTKQYSAKLYKAAEFRQAGWISIGKLVNKDPNPFVIRYVGAKLVKNSVVVLSDFANMKSLDYLIEKRKDLLPGTLRAIAKQLLEGVRLIHAKKLVHGNITSENILLHNPLGSGRIILKISNFQILKQNPSAIVLELIQGGVYPNIAPELVIGDGKTNEKIDVWSVGIVVFQLVAHELPFKAQTLEELQNQMLRQGIVKPQIAIDDHLWDLLIKMLAFNPINRISASDALRHPYFTCEQAEDEITNGANRLVKATQMAQQSGDRTITVYDITPSFIVQLTDIKKIAGYIYFSPYVKGRARFADVEYKTHEQAESFVKSSAQQRIFGGVILQVRWDIGQQTQKQRGTDDRINDQIQDDQQQHTILILDGMIVQKVS